MKFPIFRLPYVALHEVLRSMDPFELINISMISTKAKKIVRRFSEPRNPYVDFTICPIPYLWISESLKCEVTPDPSKKQETFYLDEDDSPILLKYSEDVIDGLKQLVENALNVLNAKIQSITFDISTFPSKNKDIVDWISSISESVESCAIESEETNEEAVEYLLNNLKITNNLDIVIGESNTFRGSIPKLSETLFVHNGQWLTLERLLEFDCPEICLRNTILTSADINGYLMAWMESRIHSSVKRFEMYLTNQTAHDILNNLEGHVIDLEVTREFLINGFPTIVIGGIDIHRADGATATLHSFVRNDVMHLGLLFH